MISQLVGEVKSGRELIQAQRDENGKLNKQLAAEQANSNSLGVSYDLAQREIETLHTANALLVKAAELHEKTVEILSADNERLKAEKKKANKRAAVATVVAAASIAARVLGVF